MRVSWFPFWSRFYLLASIIVVGCSTSDKLAGTEVGNPELTISARFSIEGTGDSMSVSTMKFSCMGMGYLNTDDSSGMLWGNKTGTVINMADSTNAYSMKTLKLKTGAWAKATMTLKSVIGDSTLPESVTFEQFSNPKYFKFSKKVGSQNLRFLYQMPANFDINLMYEKKTIGNWMHNDSLAIEILFDAGKWAAGLGMDTSAQIRMDVNSQAYQVLSPDENSATYSQLNAMLPRCFLADSTALR